MPRPDNRDRLPRGQVLTKKWPVLTYGDTPRLDLDTWAFRCFGLVDTPVSWTWQEERYSDQETDAMQRMRTESARRRQGR